MAIIPLQSNRQVSLTVSTPNTITPSRATVDPMAAAVGSIATEASKLTEVLAKREEEQLDLMYKNQIAADISQFEIERISRVAELQQTGTGEKPFVKGVLDDFDEAAKKIEAAYPNVYQDQVKLKLQPLQERVAASALAIQMARTERQVILNSESFANGLASNRRWGLIDDAVGEKQIAEYLSTVPDNLRAGEEAKIREQFRVAAMSNQAEADPAGFMEAVRSGAYPDAPFNVKENLYEASNRRLVAEQEARERRREQILKLAQSDPMEAARISAAERGFTNPTRQQLLDEQIQLGVHRADLAIITKAEAQNLAKDLSQIQDLDQLRVFVAQKKAEYGEKGEDWSQIERNLDQFGVEMHPAMRGALEYAGNEGAFKPEYGVALMELIKDPKAGGRATKNLKDLGWTDTEISELRTQTATTIADEAKIMERAGASEAEIESFYQMKMDAALIVAAGKERTGVYNQSAVLETVAAPTTLYEKRLNNTDAYTVPLVQGVTPYSPDFMDAIKKDWLQSPDLNVPATFPNGRLSREAIASKAGWVSYGDKAVRLAVDGATVYANGKPVIETWDGLAADVGDWKAHLSASQPDVSQDPDSTIVVIDQPLRLPATQTFKRKKRETVIPKAEQGILEPPPVNQKPVGNIQLPGMLPPPEGM